MSISNKSIAFLLLTFAISWSVAISGWALGMTGTPTATIATLTGMMTGPAIAAITCAFAFEKGRRVEALGLAFKPNWWWLAAWLIGLALAAISVGVTLLLSDRTLVDPIENVRAMVEAEGRDASKLDALPSYIGVIILVQAITLGALINAPVLTFTEELGWRGYLHGLWRPFGFWRTSLATGAIWGVWHAPAIYLFGHNYPTERVLGVGLFVIWCILVSPLMTLVRDRGGSVWAAGILHGTINAVGGLTVLWLSSGEYPWNGIAGIGGFIALALAVVAMAMLRAPVARVAAQDQV